MAKAGTVWIEVKADTSVFLRDVNAAGKAADKSLSQVSNKLDVASKRMIAFGKGGLIAGGAAAIGMYKLASAAGDLGESLSAANIIFANSTEGIEKFAAEASKTAGISKRAAVDAANTFGAFGKAAGLAGPQLEGFSTDLVQLAGDLASFKNTTPEDAIEALGAALRGEMEPIRRYNVLLDDVTLRNKAAELGIYSGNGALTQQQKVLAANAAIFERTTDAQGNFVLTSEEFANQQRTLKADLENVATTVGEGLLPAFTSITGALTDITGKFSELPVPVQKTVGAIAGIGTVALIAGSGLSIVVGQAIKMRDNFATLGSKLKTAEGGMTRFGAAARVAGGIIAGLAVYELARQIGNATENTTKFDTAIKRLQSGAAETPKQIAKEFQEMAESVEGADDKARDFLTGGLESTFDFNGYRIEIDNAREALDLLADTDGPAAIKTIEAMQAAIESQKGSFVDRNAFQDFKDDLADRKAEIEDNVKATGELDDANADAAESEAGLGDVVSTTAEEFDTATEAMQALGDAMRAQIDPFFAVQDAAQDLHDAQADLLETQKEHGKSSPEYQAALRDVAGAGLDLQTSMANVNAVLKDNPAAAKGAVDILVRMRDQGILTTEEFNNLAGQILRTIAVAKTEPDFNIKTGNALNNLNAVERKLNGIIQRTIVFQGGLQPADIPIGPALPGQTIVRPTAAGAIYSMAAGGFPSQPTILPNRPGGLVQGFEGRTGFDEAWIPTDPKYRDRALDIWAITGKKLGVPGMAGGGVLSSLFGQQVQAGHTNEQWLRLAAANNRAKANPYAGITDEQWRNLADAIKEQQEKDREKWANVWDETFENSDLAGQEQLLASKLAGLEQWTDDYKATLDQLQGVQEQRAAQAADLQAEIAGNQFDAALMQAEAAGDFGRVIGLLRGDQSKYQAWTNEWWSREQQIQRAEQDRMRAQEQAAAAAPARGGTALMERNVTHIENLTVVTDKAPRAWLDEGAWRQQNHGRG